MAGWIWTEGGHPHPRTNFWIFLSRNLCEDQTQEKYLYWCVSLFIVRKIWKILKYNSTFSTLCTNCENIYKTFLPGCETMQNLNIWQKFCVFLDSLSVSCCRLSQSSQVEKNPQPYPESLHQLSVQKYLFRWHSACNVSIVLN